MTTAAALGTLRDAIRAEVIAELVEKLAELDRGYVNEDGAYFDGYRAGVEDAIATIETQEG